MIFSEFHKYGLVSALAAAAAMLVCMAGCEGCAVFAPEGQAWFETAEEAVR